jgi:ribosomal protein L35AE/L33A
MERITNARQARKYIGQELQWRKQSRSYVYPLQVDVLHEVAGRTVRLGLDWQWLPDIVLIAPTPENPEQ